MVTPGFRRLRVACFSLLLLTGALLISGCGEPEAAANSTATEANTPQNPEPPVGIWLDEEPYLRGYPALAEAVAALGTNIRVLHTGAHPDDERSDLMAYLARGRHFRTAYLAANRGEGGQNGIGPEKGMALGVIRTEEMLAARRIDGGEQYFLSKADFGFSKTADETFKNWGHAETLKELVTFIRWYRPHVIISAFSGTPYDGHGHHQAMGILTREAFDKAADPTYQTGQPAWTTQVLFNSLYNDPGEDKIPGQRFMVDTGVYDPLLGKTYHQMAMAGRSEHRSQDMGQAQNPGPYLVPLRLWATNGPAPEPGSDPFSTVNLSRHAWIIDRQQFRDHRMYGLVETVWKSQADAKAAFARGGHGALLVALQAGLAAAQQGGTVHIDAKPQFSFSDSAREFASALYLASGVQFDVRCDRQFLTPGESGTLTVRVFPQGEKIIHPRIHFDHENTWHITQTAWTGPDQPTRETAEPLPPFWTFTYSFTVPADAAYTQPTYQPMAWAEASKYGNHHQATMDLPPIVAHLTYTLNSATQPAAQLKISTSAQYVWTDPRFGERREMVKVVPPLTAVFTPSVLAVSPSATGLHVPPVALTVTSNNDRPQAGGLAVFPTAADQTAQVQPLMPPVLVEMSHRHTSATLSLQAALTQAQKSIPARLSAWTMESDDPIDGFDLLKSFAAVTQTRIDYPHIRAHNLYAPAECRLLQLKAALPAALKIGYISGPGTDDELIDALKQMGATVTLLDEAGLAQANFKAFDTVFAGVRAYEVRPDLVTHNEKLLDWVKAGGTLIVLYQKYPFAKLNCAPATFQYHEPHDRVTEENAPVTLLKPDHLLLTWPNKITEQDFEAWLQDRGLYFFAAENRDPGYTALLSCHDENEPPKTGGLLDYSLGQGHWVYCAYALHLQIPEAVPGGWRILANLAAYGRPPEK